MTTDVRVANQIEHPPGGVALPPAHRAPAGASARLTGAQRFYRRVQRDRAVAFTVAALAAVVAHVSGFVVIDVSAALGVLCFGYASSLVFFGLYSTRWTRRHARRLAPFWMACDIAIVTSLVYLTGGVASPWFLWYLACAGAAALVGGLPWVVAVAVASAIAYVAVLVAMGEIEGLDHAMYYAVAQITFLFGASSSLILGAAKLRREHSKIKRLQDGEAIKIWELSLLTAELDEANARLRDTTVTDPLTGLHNRRYLDAQMGGSKDRRNRSVDDVTGVLIVDLDRFKRVNDTYGHPAGDQVLCHVASLLRRCVRSGDSVVRWGGEEFLVVLPDAEAGRTADVVKRILHTVRSEPCRLTDGAVLPLTCSIGWSEFSGQETAAPQATWDDAVKNADRALYMAKAAGRDRACAVLSGRDAAQERDAAAQPAPPRLGPTRLATRA